MLSVTSKSRQRRKTEEPMRWNVTPELDDDLAVSAERDRADVAVPAPPADPRLHLVTCVCPEAGEPVGDSGWPQSRTGLRASVARPGGTRRRRSGPRCAVGSCTVRRSRRRRAGAAAAPFRCPVAAAGRAGSRTARCARARVAARRGRRRGGPPARRARRAARRPPAGTSARSRSGSAPAERRRARARRRRLPAPGRQCAWLDAPRSRSRRGRPGRACRGRRRAGRRDPRATCCRRRTSTCRSRRRRRTPQARSRRASRRSTPAATASRSR